MKEELEHYRVEPDAFWQAAWVYGDGYDVMEQAERKIHGWKVVSGWGRDGYDLGSWPLVMVFFRQRNGYEVAYYVEGDVVCYAAPNEAVRTAIVDDIAFFHWKHQGEPWVEGYDSVEQVPDELRGHIVRVGCRARKRGGHGIDWMFGLCGWMLLGLQST